MRFALLLCAVLVASCSTNPTFPPAAPSTGKRQPPADRDFRASDLAKADVDLVAEVNARDAHGEPLILSNEVIGDVRNLSFEREFGKMIGYQDVMAQIAAQRTNRTIRRVVQTIATAVFLPI